MRKTATRVPKGMVTHLPDGASQRRYIEDNVLDVFSRWGYREVITPIFEYLDVLSLGLSESLLQKSLKFVDRDSGRLLILRPDFTAQIARMVGGRLFDGPKPYRLYYRGNVFRYEESHAGRERENIQVGSELIGPNSAEADSEVICMAVDCLRRLGLTSFRVSIGHAGFLRGLLSGIDSASESNLHRAIAKRDISQIEKSLTLQRSLLPYQEVFRRIPYLFGGDEVLDEAVRLTRSLPFDETIEAIQRLQEVYRILCRHRLQEHILIDLGEVRDMDYYTGIFFEMFTAGVGYPIGQGGRYDGLIGKFGETCPSTGFALEVETMNRVMKKQGVSPEDPRLDYLLLDKSPGSEEGIAILRALREQGFRVASEVMGRPLQEAMTYARQNQIKTLLSVGFPDLPKGKILKVDIPTGQESQPDLSSYLGQHGSR